MKNLIIVFFLFFGCHAFAQSKSVEAMYEKYKSHKDFFHLDMGGSFMNIAQSFNVKLDENDAKSISQSLEKIKMYKIPVDGQVAGTEYVALQKSLEKEKFDLLMEAGKPRKGVSIYGKGGKRVKDVVVLIRNEKEELMVFEALGDFDPKVISNLGK